MAAILLSTINTRAMARRVQAAARDRLGASRYQTDFEHGQWWVTELATGAQWSVVDCQSPAGGVYLDFEQVTAGDDE